MPVINAMMQPGRFVYLPPEKKGGPTRAHSSESFARTILPDSEVRRVWVGVIPDVKELVPPELARKAGRSAPGNNGDGSIGMQMVNALGPQRIPFPKMWIEFLLGDGVEWGQMAAYAMETHYGYGVAFFRLGPTGNIGTPDLVGQVEINDQGEVVDLRAAWAMDDAKDDPVEQDDHVAILKMLMPVMWAIGLMNCRNVHTVEVTPEPRRTKKQRRPRKAGVSYHTIVLPSVRYSKTAAVNPERGSLSDQPLHMVRGHTKTYTAEAPLLGRHVGTYWWGYQVRGSKENGEVVSDYRMTS